MRRLLFSVVLALCLPAANQSHSGEIQQDLGQRDAGRVAVWFGDSISRGYVLGVIPDDASDEMMSDIWWPIRSPSSTINYLTDGDLSSSFGGGPIAPDDETNQQTAAKIASLKSLTEKDLIILQDAGDRGISPTEYKRQWENVIDAALSTNAHVIVLNTYDSGPEISLPNVDWKDYSFGIPFPDQSGDMSYNDAIRAAADDFDDNMISFIDVAGSLRQLDAWYKAMSGPKITEDGIHPNVWGQCRIVALVLATAGIDPGAYRTRLSDVIAARFEESDNERISDLVAACLKVG